MISAEQFARHSASYWDQALPMLEHLVRVTNLATDRYLPPLPSPADPDRRSVVAEVAFAMFRESVVGIDQRTADERFPLSATAIASGIARVATLTGKGPSDLGGLNDDEKGDAASLGERLITFFRERRMLRPLVVGPRFDGCGLIDESEGDVLAAQTLFEIKSVERAFRSSDYRQVIVYCVLNHAKRGETIDAVGLLNPRLGTYVVQSVEELSLAVSGLKAIDLFEEIVRHISAGEISK